MSLCSLMFITICGRRKSLLTMVTTTGYGEFIFLTNERWIRKSVTIHLLAYQSTFKNTRAYCSPLQSFRYCILQKCGFPDFLHRRASDILYFKGAIFPIFEPSLLIQKSFFGPKERWIRKSVTIHLLVYQSTFKNTGTCCSPSQSFRYCILQKCDFPYFWAITLDTKVFFFTKEKMNSKICRYTLLGIPEYFAK